MPIPAHETPSAPPIEVAGVLFDLDGTLYDQPKLRRAMVVELVRAAVRAPRRTAEAVRRLRLFRSMREELRGPAEDAARAPLGDRQFDVPAARLGITPEALRGTVEEWMFERPAPALARAAWPGLRPTLTRLRALGLRLGVFSDYPPAAKLAALGVDDLFDVALGATDADVDAFKPDPAGFLKGAEALGLAPREVVYVGDRVDVDAEGARRAGMRSVIIDAKRPASPLPSRADAPRFVRTFAEVYDALTLQ